MLDLENFKTVSGNYGSESFSDRMIILGAGSAMPGNVGIGTTNPVSLLSVGNNSAFQVRYDGGTWAQGLLHAGTSSMSGYVAEFTGIGGDCTITPSPSATLSCSSDTKLKTDIEDTGSALPWIDDMRIRDFTVKATGKRETGVIAQEIQQTHPDMVHENPECDLTVEHPKRFLTVDQPNPWMLVKAIQELKAENDELRRDFDAYKDAHP